MMLLAGLPADLYLTQTGSATSMPCARACARRAASSPVEDTPIARRPHSLLVENWVLTSQSLLLRGKSSDGVLAPPPDLHRQWVPFPPQELPNMGRFYWRD